MSDEKIRRQQSCPFFPLNPNKKGWQRPNVIVSGLEIGVGHREKWAEKIPCVLRAMEVEEGS